jgi:hypothetical protein
VSWEGSHDRRGGWEPTLLAAFEQHGV